MLKRKVTRKPVAARLTIGGPSERSTAVGPGTGPPENRAVTDFAVGSTRPDKTFLLDLPVEVAERRSASRKPGR